MGELRDFTKALLRIFQHGSGVVFRDSLTGLYNRQFFVEVAEKEVARARRHERPLTLAFFDIDNFKEVNDTYGHQAGDELLKKIAEAIVAGCRKSDLTARWGGDEFVILLPETSLVGAQILADRIVSALDTVSLSYGIASWSNQLASLEEFIAQADKKMYAAKRARC